ncbi:ABC transporter permease [Nocardia asiatica]|uniref:ABC transporter permease n=1 Tax=Nocardia asiatica TaxID=209252 RepID=UPI002456F4A2|nr:ABC transporter permease [Nocardia asiatica]
MAAALLFNAMSANIGERLGELGALRAAGMRSGMLSRLIATENLALALIGIPVGVGCGILLARWLLSTYENRGAQRPPRSRDARDHTSAGGGRRLRCCSPRPIPIASPSPSHRHRADCP